MHAHLVGDDSSMHIVREEHWAANESHAYMVNVSAGKFRPYKSPMRLYRVECLKH